MKKLKVLLLVDLPGPSQSQDYGELFKTEDWATERDVLEALTALGHEVSTVGIFNDIAPLTKMAEEFKPEIVFNMAEHFNNNTSYERDVVALLEMLGLPFTGTGPLGLSLCKNKGVMKKLMAYHHIRSPKFFVLHRNKKVAVPAGLQYPFIIKPATEDGSYGIAQSSFVETPEALAERVKFVHDTMNQSALVEEYVEGRELYISMLGLDRIRVLPPRELVFGKIPEDKPKIATFKAKWDETYRKNWDIKNRFANPLAEGTMEKIAKLSRRVYRILNIRGYGRVDLRLTEKNEIMIIEANPNPAIGKEDELAPSAEKDGIPYPALIQRILQYGLQATGR